MDHSDINTSMRYVHATDPGKRRAVEAAARVSKVERCLTYATQENGHRMRAAVNAR